MIVGHDEDNSGLFHDKIGKSYFLQLPVDLCKREMRYHSTCNQDVHFFMSAPFNLLLSKDVFRKEP